MRNFIIILLTSLIVCLPTSADDLTLLIPLNPVGDSEAISRELTRHIYDEITGAKILQLISLDAASSFIEDEYGSAFDCVSYECAKDVARWMSGRYIVSGTIIPREVGIDVSLSLIDTRSDRVLKTTDGIGITDVRSFARNAARTLSGLEIFTQSGAVLASAYEELFIETPMSGASIFINSVPRGKSPDTFERIPDGSVIIEAIDRDQYGILRVDTQTSGKRIHIPMTDIDTISHLFQGNLQPGLYEVEVLANGSTLTSRQNFPPGLPSLPAADGGAIGTIQYRVREGSKIVVESNEKREVLFGGGTIALPPATYVATIFDHNTSLYEVSVNLQAGENVLIDGYVAAEHSIILEQLKVKISATERNLSYGYLITEADLVDLNALAEQASSLEGLDDVSRALVKDLISRAAEIRATYEQSRATANLIAQKAVVEAKMSLAQEARKGRIKTSNWSLILGLTSGALSVGTWYLGDWAYAEYQEAITLDDLRIWKNRTELFDSTTLGLWGVSAIGLSTFSVLRIINLELKQLERELISIDQEIASLEANTEISEEN